MTTTSTSTQARLATAIERLVSVGERVAAAVERSAEVIAASSAAGNPWAVLQAGIALVGRIAERLPPWGLVGLFAIPLIGMTIAGAPAAGPLLAGVLGAVLPGAP